MISLFIGILIVIGLSVQLGLCRLHKEGLSSSDSWALSLLWGPLFLAPISLLLADFSIYSTKALLTGIGVLGGLGFLTFLLTKSPLKSSDRSFRSLIYAVPALIVGLLLITPSFQYLHGGWDPGEYPNTANQIAREGSLVTHDPLLNTLSADEKQGLMHHWEDRRTTLQPGTLWTDWDSDELTPDYYHLYPAWLSIFSDFFGYEKVYCGQTVIALYALFAIFLLVGSIWSEKTGLLTLVFLLSSPAILFFARFTSSEMLSQFLLFTMFWAYVKHLKSDHPAFYITGAWAAGGAFLCHGINLLSLAPMGAFLLFRAVHKPRKSRTYALLLFIVLVALALARNLWHARTMSEFLIGFFFNYPIFATLFVALSLMAFCAATLFVRRKTFPAGLTKGLAKVVPILLTLLGLFLYFVFPKTNGSHDSYNLVLLSWQVSAPLLILALLYFFLEKWGQQIPEKALLFLICGLPFALLLANKSIQPLMMWCMRRYVPILIPFVCILAAVAVFYLWTTRKRGLQIVAMVLVLSGLAINIYRALPMLRVTDFQNLPSNLSSLAKQLEEADFILFDHPYYSTPMARTFDLPAYQYTEFAHKYLVNRSYGAWSVLTNKALAGENAYWVSHLPDTQFFGRGFHPVFKSDYVDQYTLIKRIRIGMPRRTEDKRGHLRLYQLQVTPENYRYPEQVYVIDIGNCTIGMHENWDKQIPRREKMVRWTLDESSLYVPSFRAKGTEYILSLNAGRKGGGDPIAVEIALDGEVVEQLSVSNGWHDYTVTVAAGTGGEITPRLSIKSETWNPAEFGIKGYQDGLGVMVDKIRIKPLGYATTESM